MKPEELKYPLRVDEYDGSYIVADDALPSNIVCRSNNVYFAHYIANVLNEVYRKQHEKEDTSRSNNKHDNKGT